MLSVIGIHSKIDDHGKVSFHSGHAWLTLHYTNGRRASVGLWPDRGQSFASLFIRDPIGVTKSTEEKFTVCWDLEIRGHYKPFASRYYGLRQGEQIKAIGCLGRFTGWRIGNNCTTWATEKIKEVFGVGISHSDFWGLIDTPRSLGATLQRLEAKSPSAVNRPVYPNR